MFRVLIGPSAGILVDLQMEDLSTTILLHDIVLCSQQVVFSEMMQTAQHNSIWGEKF